MSSKLAGIKTVERPGKKCVHKGVYSDDRAFVVGQRDGSGKAKVAYRYWRIGNRIEISLMTTRACNAIFSVNIPKQCAS